MLFVAVCNRKMLSRFHVSQTVISQSKLSGTRKVTLKYKYFGMNFDFEISRVYCISKEHYFSHCNIKKYISISR